VAMGLLVCLKHSKLLIKSTVGVLPEQVGRRERRLKSLLANAFPLFVSVLLMYMIAGAYISIYFSSLFLLATLMAIGLCFASGFMTNKPKAKDMAWAHEQEA